MKNEEFISLEEVAEQLHVTVDTVRAWVREKQLPAYRIGRAYLVKPEDLRRFIEERRTQKKDE